RSPLERWSRALPAITIAFFAAVYFWIYRRAVGQIDSGMGDFYTFYHGARAMLDGRDIYTSGVVEYNYPPLIAFLYQPLALLNFPTACRVSTLINIVLSCLSIIIAAREIMRRLGIEGAKIGAWGAWGAWAIA